MRAPAANNLAEVTLPVKGESATGALWLEFPPSNRTVADFPFGPAIPNLQPHSLKILGQAGKNPQLAFF